VTLFVIAALTANAYPKPDDSQSVTLALLHLPFVLWAVVGYAFAPAPWSGVGWRTDYLRLNGEAVVYTALVLITGMLMTAITMALFHAIKVDVDQWYGGWVAVYGACSAPIVGMHLALTRMRAGFAIAPLIARIFSPLALLILMAYLGAMVLQGRSPYGEREFLIVFNGMLLSVLGIAVFCICERRAGRFSDAVLCALLIVALVIDLIRAQRNLVPARLLRVHAESNRHAGGERAGLRPSRRNPGHVPSGRATQWRRGSGGAMDRAFPAGLCRLECDRRVPVSAAVPLSLGATRASRGGAACRRSRRVSISRACASARSC
jgi:hypothetical protein